MSQSSFHCVIFGAQATKVAMGTAARGVEGEKEDDGVVADEAAWVCHEATTRLNEVSCHSYTRCSCKHAHRRGEGREERGGEAMPTACNS